MQPLVRNVGFVLSVLIYTKMKDFYGTLFSYKNVLVNSFPLVAMVEKATITAIHVFHCSVPVFELAATISLLAMHASGNKKAVVFFFILSGASDVMYNSFPCLSL